MYHITDVVGLQDFLREEFNLWAENGSWVEETWESYKDVIFEGIKRYEAQKIEEKSGP